MSADVAVDQQVGAELGGERPHPLLERLALVGEGQLGALVGQCPGDSPGQRPVVGEAHDQPALALHQSGSKLRSPCFQLRLHVLAGLRLLDFELVGVRPGIDFAL